MFELKGIYIFLKVLSQWERKEERNIFLIHRSASASSLHLKKVSLNQTFQIKPYRIQNSEATQVYESMMKMVGKNFCTNDSSRPKAFNGKGFAFHMRRPQSSSSSSSTWASFSLRTLKKERFNLINGYSYIALSVLMMQTLN